MKSNYHTLLNRRESLRLLSLAALAGRAHAEAVPTASLAAAPTAFYRSRIGASQALVLSEGFMPGPIHPFFAPEGTSAEVTELLAANFQSPITAQIPVNVLLVQLGGEWVLFDAGSGSGFGPSTGQLQKSLAAAGVRPEQISAIFLTHAHPDHIGGVIDSMTKELLFPRALLNEIASLIAEVTGLPWRYEPRAPEEFFRTITATGADPVYMACVRNVFERVRNGSSPEISDTFDTVERLTGRAPTSLRAFVEKHRATLSYDLPST
jgi:Metallo-beta-lactamase superfamily